MKEKEPGADDPAMFAPSTAARMISALDVQQKEFRVSRFSGYRMRDVDEFLDEVTDALAALTTENERLRADAPAFGATDLEDARRRADEIVEHAREEAARILSEASKAGETQTGAAAVGARPVSSEEERSAVQAFLSQEKRFLESLGGLVQAHAEAIKEMVRAARNTTPEPSRSVDARAEDADSASDSTENTVAMQKPESEPIRVEEPEPASVPRSDRVDAPKQGERSLRELFWGEEN